MELPAARELAESTAAATGARAGTFDGEPVAPVVRRARAEPDDGPPVLVSPPLPMPPAAEHSFLGELMRLMAANKALPKYQFERRVDAFLAVLLPDLLGQLLGTTVTFAVPEFPLKKHSSNQSTNVDHLYFDHRGRWLFVEIKTDANSVQQDQIDIYLDAARRGMGRLIDDIRAIRQATDQPVKYTALLDRLGKFPSSGPIDVLYLAPAKSAARGGGMRVITYAELGRLEHTVFPEAWDQFRRLLIPAID